MLTLNAITFNDILKGSFFEKLASYQMTTLDAIIALIVSLALSADRVTSAEEYRLFVDITKADISYDDFYQITNIGDLEGALKSIDEFVDSMTENGKNCALTLALCFISADDKITPQEQKLFAILLA